MLRFIVKSIPCYKNLIFLLFKSLFLSSMMFVLPYVPFFIFGDSYQMTSPHGKCDRNINLLYLNLVLIWLIFTIREPPL